MIDYRELIRNEFEPIQKANTSRRRREVWMVIMTAIGTISAIIAAITGLVLVL